MDPSSAERDVAPVYEHDRSSTRTAFDSIDAEAQEEVVQLARTVTNASLAHQGLSEGDNPFEGSTDPRLDPNSGKFDYHLWIRHLLSLGKRDLDRPRRTAGIAYRGLNVFGYGKATDHQKTVGGVLLDIPGMFGSLVGNHGRRIDILRDFEGLVKAGEMLVVLGRPGRCVFDLGLEYYLILLQRLHDSPQVHRR